MQTSGHILSEFDIAMNSFKEKTITIGQLSQQNLDNALTGLFERNAELCNKVIVEDEDVDQLEISIDQEGVSIMSRFRPFAGDLRIVIASMKITNNLERISDHAVSIAKRSRKLLRNPEVPETALIRPIYEKAQLMLTDAVKAYKNGDEALALEIIERDTELNLLHKNATKQLTKCMESEAESNSHKDHLNLIFISRWLERVGDLAVNIAEDVVYMETAADIRHGGDLPE